MWAVAHWVLNWCEVNQGFCLSRRRETNEGSPFSLTNLERWTLRMCLLLRPGEICAFRLLQVLHCTEVAQEVAL